MRLAMVGLAFAALMPFSASAAIPNSASAAASKGNGVQVADYYKNGKVCRKAGSATVCN